MTEPVPPRTFEAVADPARRPVYRRSTVRLLVVDPDGRVLLFRDRDPNVDGLTWWMTPGGGIDPGESEADAAVRELAEETGHGIGAHQLVGPLARRHVVHGYSDRVLHQDDVFYTVRTPSFTVSSVGHTAEEQVTMGGSRWWPVAELAATTETVWPAELLEVLALTDDPSAWPVQLAAVEESSVPV